jgi:hypothetical protein
MCDFALISGKTEANGLGRDLDGLTEADGPDSGALTLWPWQALPNEVHTPTKTTILNNERMAHLFLPSSARKYFEQFKRISQILSVLPAESTS